MENWTIKITNPGYEIAQHVFIYRRTFGNKLETLDGKLHDYGTPIEPTLKLEPEQLQAFSNALNLTGYKPQSGFVEGKLEATERHMADLRTLLKLK